MVKRIASLMVLVSMAAGAADPRPYEFNLTVRLGEGLPIVVQQSLPPGTYRDVEVTPALHFDLITPADGRSPTIVRLIDRSGAEPKVLHTAQRGGTPELVRLSLYTVCRDGVYFESPTPTVSAVKCKG